MIRDKVLKYLYESGFVQFYTKKLLYREDINDLYEDYLQEVWLQICEIDEKKWEELYNRRTNQDEFYDIRNWLSVLIRNTVVSTIRIYQYSCNLNSIFYQDLKLCTVLRISHHHTQLFSKFHLSYF